MSLPNASLGSKHKNKKNKLFQEDDDERQFQKWNDHCVKHLKHEFMGEWFWIYQMGMKIFIFNFWEEDDVDMMMM